MNKEGMEVRLDKAQSFLVYFCVTFTIFTFCQILVYVKDGKYDMPIGAFVFPLLLSISFTVVTLFFTTPIKKDSEEKE